MRTEIIEYIIEENQMQNWDEGDDGKVIFRPGHYFSCNYFQVQDLLNDMSENWPQYDEDSIHKALNLVLEEFDYDHEDLEKTLQKIWNARATLTL